VLQSLTSGNRAEDEVSKFLTRQAAVANPNYPARLLARAARDKHDKCARLAAAQSSQLPPELLLKLARDPSPMVVTQAAAHPALALPELQRLASDQIYTVREAVASNPRCPPQILAQLAHDQDGTVLAAVARHPASDTATLERVMDSANRDRSQHTAPIRLQIELAIVRHLNSSPSLLHQLGSENFVLSPPGTELDQRIWIVQAVAENPSTQPDTLELLSRHAGWNIDKTVRPRVAAHPNTPVAVLEQMLRDTDPTVIRAAANNPSLPQAVLAMWQLARS